MPSTRKLFCLAERLQLENTKIKIFSHFFYLFSKYATGKVLDKINGPKVINFLDDYTQTHGVPRNNRLE